MDKITTPNGPLYVWRPEGITLPPRAVVVYVHGYWDTAASAIAEHHLQAQFAAAGAEVPFLVPEAPDGPGQPVKFPDLVQLLAYAGIPASAQVVAIAHSGGYKTVAKWLASPALRHLILLDAAYGNLDDFKAWGKLPGHTMALVGSDTASTSKAIAAAVHAPYFEGKSHMGIVTTEGWIARLLRAAPPLARRLGTLATVALLALAAWGVSRLA